MNRITRILVAALVTFGIGVTANAPASASESAARASAPQGRL